MYISSTSQACRFWKWPLPQGNNWLRMEAKDGNTSWWRFLRSRKVDGERVGRAVVAWDYALNSDQQSDYEFVHFRCSSTSKFRAIHKSIAWSDNPNAYSALENDEGEWEETGYQLLPYVSGIACSDGDILEISNDGSVLKLSTGQRLKLDKRVCGLN